MELSSKDKESLSELLLDWEEAFEKGREISPQTLCGNQLHLLEAATIAIQTLKLASWTAPPSPPDILLPDPSWEACSFIQTSSVLKNRFRIDSILGHGGQGIIYKAFDLQLKRFVAIKTTKNLSVLQSECKQLLLEEAQKIAGLNHPGIVPLFDIIEFHDSFLFVSEYLEAGDLEKALKDGALSLNQKISIFKNVALALHYAHMQGIIHRDIKPSNILLTQNLDPKICDFGVAFKFGDNMFPEHMGSIAYASPEQINGKRLNCSSDIWSMGVLLYEAFTNKLPFQGGNTQEILLAILHSELKFPKKAVLGKLAGLILQCLAKEPNSRPKSAIAIANILSEIEKEINPAFMRRKYLLRIASLLTGFGIMAFICWRFDFKKHFLINPRAKETKPWQVTSETTVFLNSRLNRLEHYNISDPFHWEQVSPNGFVGKPNAHNIQFKHPLLLPFTLHFQIKVRSGFRVRMIFENWDIHLGNEGFSRQISVFGDGKTIQIDQPYRYQLQEELRCRFLIDKNNYSLHINDQLVSEGLVKPQTQPLILTLSSGDPFSPGEVVFSNLLLEPN